MNRKLIVFGVLGLLGAAFAVGAWVYQKQQTEQVAQSIDSGEAALVRDHSPAMGHPLYRVTLVEFLDPECESCRRFHPVVKKLLKKYENSIYYVVRYAPFHRHSKEAVAFLEAARIQGKYWEALDLLFERQPQWADHHHPRPEVKWTYLSELGLDEAQMRRDVKLPKIQKMIELDIKDGSGLRVRGTPTFFVNGQPLEKFGPEFLEQKIQQALGIDY